MSDSKEKKGFDVSDLIPIAWRRKWIIIIPLILVTVATFAGSYLITPKYLSAVIVWVGNPVKLSTDLQRLLGDGRQVMRSERDMRLELQSLQNEITSSPYLSQLIVMLKLDQDPEIAKRAMRQQADRPDLSLEQITTDYLIGKLRKNINVSYAGKDQIQIMVESIDPYLARDMAQNLGEIFISEKMRQELGSVRISQDFSYEQLGKYERDLQDRINDKTAFEKEYMKIQLDELVASEENRRAISSEIQAANFEIQDKKDEETGYLTQLADRGISKSKLKLKESNELRRLKNDVKDLIETIGSLMQKYQWSDPEILNFNNRMYNLIGQIENENKKLVDEQFEDHNPDTRAMIVSLLNVRSEMDMLYARANNLELALADLNNKINLVPEYEARLDQLNREITAARDLRDKFKEQQESSQISQALLRETKYKVIEPAKVPFAPYKPERPKIVVLGLLLGLAIGFGAALLTEVLDNSFKSIEDVEKTLDTKVIGVVPEITFLKKFPVRK
ncbi:MAG: hypothetical protein JSV44_00835 [Candidatus Zixiibacteriota bacterium]|nr:MAG: hypothetical protein JSV44_00835 [candidate division Zixibacteria bacterium]